MHDAAANHAPGQRAAHALGVQLGGRRVGVMGLLSHVSRSKAGTFVAGVRPRQPSGQLRLAHKSVRCSSLLRLGVKLLLSLVE